MNKQLTLSFVQALFVIFLVSTCSSPEPKQAVKTSTSYDELVTLFKSWREFESPELKDGAPDYSAPAMANQYKQLSDWQQKLNAFDTAKWPIKHQVDWYLVWAEMNGFDFNHRVLQPWVRDPAYYKVVWMERSDVPAHEGPTNHGTIELWTYTFPLSSEAQTKLTEQLRTIKPFYAQAQQNLTGNAKELWVAGIRDIRTQAQDLQDMLQKPSVKEQAALVSAIDEATQATNSFAEWLEKESVNKTGPSGIGKDNYTWYQQNVHLVPMTWEDEVLLLKRELARAWTGLKLEEHNNRKLPPLPVVDSPEAFNALAERSAKSMLNFLNNEEIVTVKDYFEPALREHLGSFVPADKRNFFIITTHHDPRPLYSHFYHWFELARMDREPHSSEMRKGPLLYNIFDSRNEGTATAVEEMFMQAGLYNDDPRVKEIVYILIAQRAARGLGSLYAQANETTMAEAGKIHTDYTPRGWMKVEKDLMQFEQHLYMRQPGYGSSYITGKYLLERTMADYARMKEIKNEPFVLKDFFDALNASDCIPISLANWEISGSRADLIK